MTLASCDEQGLQVDRTIMVDGRNAADRGRAGAKVAKSAVSGGEDRGADGRIGGRAEGKEARLESPLAEWDVRSWWMYWRTAAVLTATERSHAMMRVGP